jgi:PAS domain S-box-containing protein
LADGSEDRSEFHKIILGLPGAAVLLSHDLKVKLYKDSYHYFLPKKFDGLEMLGTSVKDILAGAQADHIFEVLQRVSSTREKFEMKEFHVTNEDGMEFWLEWAALPIDDGAGRADILITISDITEIKQAHLLSEALNRVNSYINSTLDYDEIMGRVMKEGAKALGAESSLINIREGGHWVARFVHDFPSDVLGSVRSDQESPISTMAANERGPIAIDDIESDPRVNPQVFREFRVRSLLVAPILLRDDVMGVIAFYYHSKRHRFLKTHIDFVVNLTSSLSQAINNSQNYTEAKMAEDLARHQNVVLEGINRIFHESIVTATVEQLGRVCLDIMEAATNSKFGFIGQLNPEGLLDDDAISDPGWKACKMVTPTGHGRLPISMKITGLYGRVITDGKGFFTNSPMSHPDSTGVPPGHPPLTAFLGVPLKSAGKVIGMIGLGNKDGGYSQSDLSAAEAMAPAIVEALQRKKAEKDLTESEGKYRGLFANMQEAVTIRQYVYDENGDVVDQVIVDANPAALKAMGAASIDAVKGKRESTLFGLQALGRMLEEFQGMKLERGPIVKETHLPESNRDYLTTIVPLGNDQVIYNSTDITERKRAETEQATTAEFLRLVNESTGITELIQRATCYFQKSSGVEAVGIRIREGHDYPYYEARGFPEHFIQLENSLCARDEKGCPLLDEMGEPVMECTCGCLIRGVFDPARPFYTKLGSFWTNSTTDLGSIMTDEDIPPRHRNRCVGEGYESIALIPLFVGRERLGLLQLNDHRRGRFTFDQIVQWERLAGHLAVAVSKFRAEQDLRESETKYRGLFENLQEGVIIRRLVFDDHDRVADRIIVDANPAALKALGVTIGQVKGKRQDEFLSYDTESTGLADIRKIREIGGPIVRETHFNLTDRDYLTTVIPLGEDYIITTSVDITETKQAQRALAENYEAARQRAEEVERLMDIIPSAIWVSHDPECRVIIGNIAADRFYEASPGENVSAGLASGGEVDTTRRFFKEGRELSPEELPMQEAAFKGRQIINSELEVVTPSGRTITILGSATPLLNPEGKVRGAIAAFVDITDRKKQEQELEEIKGRLEAIIGQMPVGIIVTEARTGKVLFANEEIQRIYQTGFNLTDIHGFNEYRRMSRYHLDGRQYETDEYPFVRALKGEVIRNEVALLKKRDGSDVYISSSSAPVYDRKGSIMASVALSIDVTEQVKVQRERDRLLTELERHSDKLMRSNTELQQFAYVASHDLQEPLRMVTAYLGLLQKKFGDQLEGQAKEYMAYAMEGGLRARDLIRDLLEISRVGSQGKEKAPTDMNVVIANACDNLSIQIKDENATITKGGLPVVMADDAQMTVLLQNLISNAVKFHGKEAPVVEISAQDEGDEWRFSVKDNGIGIDPQFKDKIFIIFQRLHSRIEYEGTGIGLAIAKKIVERHGGRIWFESQPGQGTTFYFTIPKEASNE